MPDPSLHIPWSSAWLPGWRMRSCAWPLGGPGRAGPAFRAGTQPGDLFPDSDPPLWSFHLGLKVAPSRLQVRMLANGYHLLAGAGIDQQWITAHAAAAGVLTLTSNQPLDASLFSPEQPVHEQEGQSWLEWDDQAVVLMKMDAKDLYRCVLAAGTGTHADLVNQARECLAGDVEEAYAVEMAAREEVFSRFERSARTDAAALVALEGLIGNLRPAEGRLAHLWSAEADREVFLANAVPALVDAWIFLDASVAIEFLRSLLAQQRSDGHLPGAMTPKADLPGAPAPWPLFAHAARKAWASARDADFLGYALPRLERYLLWALRHFEHGKDGIHSWGSPRDAWIAETFDRKLASADLTAFLLREIDAFDEMHRAAGNAELPPSLESARQTLAGNLRSFFWDPESSTFKDRYVGGGHLARITLSSLIPMIWPGLEPSERQYLLGHLNDTRVVRRKHGSSLWQEMDNDTEPAPVPLRHQRIVLEGLGTAGTRHEVSIQARALWAFLRSYAAREGHFPPFLGGGPESDEPGGSEADALAILVLAYSDVSSDALSRPMKWMDRHRKTVLGIPLIVLIAAIVGIIVFFLHRTHPPLQTAQSMIGLAERHNREGRHEEAIRILDELLEAGVNKGVVGKLLGDNYFKMQNWIEASRHYGIAMEASDNPLLAYNYGLTLHRSGKEAEATRAFNDLITVYSNSHPAIAGKARFTLDLIRKGSEE